MCTVSVIGVIRLMGQNGGYHDVMMLMHVPIVLP